MPQKVTLRRAQDAGALGARLGLKNWKWTKLAAAFLGTRQTRSMESIDTEQSAKEKAAKGTVGKGRTGRARRWTCDGPTEAWQMQHTECIHVFFASSGIVEAIGGTSSSNSQSSPKRPKKAS